ncbi:hypothetical protein MHK74_02715, partial [Microbacterium aurum]|uniref:hypothetical protein n=1 Tax=Microbacterium aurum TaxID=36805 RepID=UPI001EF67154
GWFGVDDGGGGAAVQPGSASRKQAELAPAGPDRAPRVDSACFRNAQRLRPHLRRGLSRG